MDWLTFIVSETKALAWPLVALVAIFLFRKQIALIGADLSKRLLSAKGAGFELSFGERIDEVQASLQNSGPASEPREIDESQRTEETSSLLSLPPGYIVSQAWLRVEDELGRAIRVATSQPGQRLHISQVQLLRAAEQQGLISKEEAQLLSQLRELRNQAAHTLDTNITLTDALRYNDIATLLVQRIKDKENKR